MTILKQDMRSQLSRHVNIIKEVFASADVPTAHTIDLLVSSLSAAQMNLDLRRAENDIIAELPLGIWPHHLLSLTSLKTLRLPIAMGARKPDS
jgi:hypothetical protein